MAFTDDLISLLRASPVASIAVALVTVLVVYLAIGGKADEREPPHVKAGIPVIGHALGLMFQGTHYYKTAATKTNAPIFTLNIMGTRLYIVKSAKIVAAVQRNAKILSFDPFLTAAAERMAGITGPGLKLLQETHAGGGGLNQTVVHASIPSLMGSGLDEMNRTMLVKIEPLINQRIETEGEFDLMRWCRDIITTASSEAVWGAKNPFRNEQTMEDFWYFESNTNILLANMLPWLTARKAWQCRERFVDAMEAFARAGGYEEKDCSELARARRDAQRDAGATIRDTARLEMSLNVGVLSNTAPSTFWYIHDVFSRPDLLVAIRRELEQHAVVTPDPSTPNKRAVDISSLRGDCPLLVAAFQETLRLHSNGAPIRFVYEDVVLDNQFLLKKGSLLQMSAPVIHSEQTHWGLDASKFDATRFDSNVAIPGQKATTAHTKPRATSYMAWGASPNLCPGRHFATAEILATAAMLILRTDVTTVKGKWWLPKLNSKAMAAAMSPPGEAYPVRIKKRKEVEGLEWTFVVSGQKDRFGLITG